LVIFLLYFLAIGIWQNVVFFTAKDTETNVYQSSMNAGVQHYFRLSCHDPLGCIVGSRLQKNDEDYIPPSNPSDPCNSFHTQFYQMKNNEIITAAICYVDDPDNGVAVLVHDGGSVQAHSSSEAETISDDTDWDDTFGFQTMISMTPITMRNYISGDSHDDWIIIEQKNEVIPLNGFFFRCDTPAKCGCNTTYFNETNSNCEAFIFRMDEVGYEENVFRPFSYITIISQIVSLAILGYVILRMVLAVVFRIEKRMDGDTLEVKQDEYRDIEDDA